MDEMPSFLQDNTETIKNVSYDSANNEYMTTSALRVINFDKLKGWYMKKINIGGNLDILSNDALFFGENKIVFMEFKNGAIDRVENNKIIFKIYDSILMLFDKIISMDWYACEFEKNISFARDHIEYILVYNAERQNDETPQTRKGFERQVASLQVSEGRDEIGKYFRHRSHEGLIKFGLDRFKNYIFKNVYTITKTEFEAKVIPILLEDQIF